MGSEARLNGAEGRAGSPTVVLATAASGARGSDVLAAALATCAADERRAALLVEVGGGSRPRRPTLLASPAARRCEAELRDAGVGAAARGLICHVAAGEGADGLDRAAEAITRPRDCAVCVLHVEAALWLAALDHPGLAVKAAVIRAELPRDRSLAGWRCAICEPAGWRCGWRCTRSAGPRGGGPSPACGSAAPIRLGCGAGQRRCWGAPSLDPHGGRNRRARSEPRRARRCPR